MKRLWLVGVLLLALLGFVLARHTGLLGISGNGPEQQQTTAAGSGTTDSAGESSASTHASQSPTSEAEGSTATDSTSADSSPSEKTDTSADTATDNVAGQSADGATANADAAADAADEGAAPGEAVTKGTFEKGDTVSKVLESAGGQGVNQYVSAARQVFSMRSFREGQPYIVVTDKETGQVKRFEYEIDSRRRLVVEGTENPAARVEPIEYVVLLASVEATINDNLFQAVADIGENPQMALKLADLFGSEVNFIRDLQSGDSFSVLVEKRYRDSEYKGYGRILAAHFTNKGKTYEAYLFRDGSQRAEYYNRKGENLRKTLLQAPLAFTRISSRFTNSRLHPILNYRRAHHGVDYAAPTGTPVKAVGDGLVTQRGWAGGYGNQIIVKHVAGLESMYAHLSGYARGLATGQRVRQGQVIGFVGSTGLATGPHLDFRLRQNGKFIDPTKAINPRGEPVARKAMAEFEKIMALELAYLKGEKNLSEYEADSLVPDVPVTAPEKPVEKEKKKPAQKGRR
ncbi:MAG: peptidoglycan DD-metalloendopeptidase family protein [Desulfovibrio sp.]|uniref:M23 family metallopeptidase n=1 Tax=Desulfovibrio sp. TaxID=885 RepID=UPI0039E4E021